MAVSGIGCKNQYIHFSYFKHKLMFLRKQSPYLIGQCSVQVWYISKSWLTFPEQLDYMLRMTECNLVCKLEQKNWYMYV